MLQLLMVRHGETDWNLTHRFQGHSDVPLNKNGREQVAAIARRLASEDLHTIYASDLSRAWDTAVAIGDHHTCEIIADPRIREGNFGQWEGMTYAEIETRDPQAVKAWHEDLLNFAPPDGETPLQVAARVAAFNDDLRANHQNETLLLVAHGGALQILICLLLDISIEKFWQFNLDHCSLTKISVYPEGAIINLLNDANHITHKLSSAQSE